LLDAAASSALAGKLIDEIASLGSEEAAIEWARGSVSAKDTLTTEDAGSWRKLSGPGCRFSIPKPTLGLPRRPTSPIGRADPPAGPAGTGVKRDPGSAGAVVFNEVQPRQSLARAGNDRVQ
jgi:hypothetical protein